MEEINTRARTRRMALIALAVAVVGVAAGGAVAAWVAGSLGISAAAASQVVAAIEVGGAALTIVGAIFGAGLVGAIIGTVRYLLFKQARNLVIA